MAFSVKQAPWCSSGFLVRPRSPLPFISLAAARCRQRCLSLNALHIYPAHAKKKDQSARLVLKCSAESDHREVDAPNPIEKMILDICFWEGSYSPESRTCLIIIIIVAFNYAVYNIAWNYALSLFPYPLLLSAVYLGIAFFCILYTLMKGDYPFPETDLDFWKSLFLVAVAHTVGHVATVVSLSKSSAFFTETMRCGEPVFSVLLSSWFLLQGKTFPVPAIAYGNHIEVVYMCFPDMDRFSFITASIMKKIFLIVVALAYYKSYQPINALGAAMAILGILLYSRELCKVSRAPSWCL